MRPLVMLQNDCLAYYRRDIYSLLCACDQIRCTVVAGMQPGAPFLKTLGTGDVNGIRHYAAHVREIRLPAGRHLTWQGGALRFFWKERPRVVIALGSPYSLTTWVLTLLGRFRKIPVLLWGHGLLADESGPKWWIRRFLYSLAWGHLLYGDHAKALLQGKGFPSERLYVVYNSLSYDEQILCASKLTPDGRTATRAKLGIPPDSRILIFTGRLEQIKRLDLLIGVMALLKSRGRELYAILVGDGVQRSMLEQLARDHGLGANLRFIGAVYEERSLAELYGASDLAVVPSGAGLSVIHALTYGVPVLLHDRTSEHFPECEAVQPGKTGFYYRYGDLEDMARKVEEALYPVPRRQEMSPACRAVVREKYNPHRQLETILCAVADALDSSGGAQKSGGSGCLL